VAFGYDALGHRTTMTRYQDPTNQAGPVTTTWHTDSLGQVTMLEQPGVAAQTRTFDSWGEVTQVQWCNDLGTASCPQARIASLSPVRRDGPGEAPAKTRPAANRAGDRERFQLRRQFECYRGSSAQQHAGRGWPQPSGPRARSAFTYDDLGRLNSRIRRHHGNAQSAPLRDPRIPRRRSKQTYILPFRIPTRMPSWSITITTRPAASNRSSIVSVAVRKPCSRPPAKARSTMCSAALLARNTGLRSLMRASRAPDGNSSAM
jgi:hypothetical protein